MATVDLHITPFEANMLARDYELKVETIRDGVVRITGSYDEVEEAADIYDPRAARDIRR